MLVICVAVSIVQRPARLVIPARVNFNPVIQRLMSQWPCNSAHPAQRIRKSTHVEISLTWRPLLVPGTSVHLLSDRRIL